MKARLLFYAASPLNNPNNDKSKWQKAADAAEVLLNAGYELNKDYQNFLKSGNIYYTISFQIYNLQLNENK